jgi:hypothetical protein
MAEARGATPHPLFASGARETAPIYVYLCYGRSPAAERELRYSFETLRAEIDAPALSSLVPPPTLTLPRKGGGDDGADVVIYTDRPAAFADLGAAVIDATALIRESFAHAYRHRLKPAVLADALRRFHRPCVMLDLDSFIRPGFAATVAQALAQGAAMNQFVRADAYPDFPAFETNLPHLGRYRLDRAPMLNSGLVAVSPAHLPLVEDAVALIDLMWAAGLRRHDIEQFAVAETLRLGGVRIALIDDVFVHYCARWARRYMRRRLRRRRAGERIAYSKGRVRLFKTYWTLRLAMRKAGLSWGAIWRKT